VRSKHVGILFDAEGTFDLQWLRQRSDPDLDIRHCSTFAACPDAASLVIVVQSCGAPADSWYALQQLERRYPGVPTFLASRASSGEWSLASAQVHQIGPLPEVRTLSALAGGFHGERQAPEMVGSSAAIGRTRDVIARIAGSDTNVLITGESGTGKELVAEIVHRASSRRRGPFVAVNCAAIPDTLFESELFGHQRGAFTGAITSRAGRFGEAHGGTLFLDEIGELNHYGQAKILRAVETGRIDRVGAHAAEVDIRCIAATNRDLEEMVTAGTFRQDLYFRLNVVEISLSPLRERLDDLPALIEHYIRRLNIRFGQLVERVDEELLDVLKSYAWPGNIRELRNVLESIYAHRPKTVLSLADLPDAFRRRLDLKGPDEKQRLLATLHATNWNKSAAAKELHWSRVTLYRKLLRYDLSPSPKAG
jgi:transcriptional regulator with PAS, ATPase and Fis domain